MSQIISLLKKAKYLDDLIFKVCIVGSRKMSQKDDYGSGIWNIFAPNLTIYGLDADEDACEEANNNLKKGNINWQEKHFPVIVSDQIGTNTLYVTRGVDCSSLYPPNEPLLNRFAAFDNHIKLEFTLEIETITLDYFCQMEKLEGIDFLYMDVQGAELNVLKGANSMLNKSILGVQLEVEFSPLYIDQPLFSNVDNFLRQYGFVLFDLMTEHPMCRRPRSNSKIYSSQKIGQLLWADALYFRDSLLDNAPQFLQNPEQLFKLACIADIFDYPDYSLELLAYLTRKYPNNSKYNFTEIITAT